MIRHVLYLSDDAILMSTWHDSRLLSQVEFFGKDSDEGKFKHFCQNLSHDPVQILFDLQEEDYQRETVPHVKKKEQYFIANRLLEKNYRDATYSRYEIQGRNEDGRKDSRVLLSAITIDDNVKYYIDILHELKMPIAGIWSAPLLSYEIASAVTIKNDHYILIFDEGEWARESFYINNELIVSRKIRFDMDIDDRSKANVLSSSIDHLHKFATNKRLISFQDKIESVCVFNESLFDFLKDFNINDKVDLNHIDKVHIFDALSIDESLQFDAKVFYSYICTLQKISKPHYNNLSEAIDFISDNFNNLVCKSLFSISMVFFLFSCVVFVNNYYLKDILDKQESDLKGFELGYNQKFSEIQPILENIESIVGLLNEASVEYAKASMMPSDIFSQLGEILSRDEFYKMSVHSMQWKRYSGVEYEAVSALFSEPAEESDEYADDLDTAMNVEEEISGVYMHLSGDFDYEYLDYAGAQSLMVSFEKSLSSIDEVDGVYMITAPVDLRSQSQFVDTNGAFVSDSRTVNTKFEFVIAIKEKQAMIYEN